mmetsp:Transcript_45753/g.113600  ORF Transcript_45753/g.113600 Transcript_45753/m.113600 type:complete len:181 (-) Transcript_45753:270-812(-)
MSNVRRASTRFLPRPIQPILEKSPTVVTKSHYVAILDGPLQSRVVHATNGRLQSAGTNHEFVYSTLFATSRADTLEDFADFSFSSVDFRLFLVVVSQRRRLVEGLGANATCSFALRCEDLSFLTAEELPLRLLLRTRGVGGVSGVAAAGDDGGELANAGVPGTFSACTQYFETLTIPTWA